MSDLDRIAQGAMKPLVLTVDDARDTGRRASDRRGPAALQPRVVRDLGWTGDQRRRGACAVRRLPVVGSDRPSPPQRRRRHHDQDNEGGDGVEPPGGRRLVGSPRAQGDARGRISYRSETSTVWPMAALRLTASVNSM